MLSSSSRRGTRVSACFALLCATAMLPGTAAATVEYTAARKAGRGAAGLVCGFLEIPGNMFELSNEQGVATGLTIGFAQGIGMLVVRTLVGSFELITAPLAVPEGYKPVLEPEFPWSYFEGH